MKITRHGAVIITNSAIRIEGWLVEPEATDPPDESPEQTLIWTVAKWALAQLQMEILKATKGRKTPAELPGEVHNSSQSESVQSANPQSN